MVATISHQSHRQLAPPSPILAPFRGISTSEYHRHRPFAFLLMSILLKAKNILDPPDPSAPPHSQPPPQSLPQSSVSIHKQNELTLPQRMLSAGLGSILTAFVLTPFDVIRIRMQQQVIMPETKPCCSSRLTKELATRKNTLVNNSSDTHLFWLDKEYCKSTKNCLRIDSTFQGFFTIGRNEGFATLWRGISLTLVMAIPANVIYFTAYEYIRDHSPYQGLFNSLVCGASARVMAATSVAPLELIKTRLQSIPASGSNPKVLSNVIKGTWAGVKTNGLGSLFKGLQITLWRDVPFLGIYWSLYETCKKEFSRRIGADFNQHRTAENDTKVFATSFLSGSVAGIVAAVLTHPFDVGKTRLQISQDNNSSTKHPLMFRYLHQIYRNEGFGTLFGGLGPRVIKIAPSCAIMISSYEISKVFFKS